MNLKQLLQVLYPLHRTLASDGTDEALEIIGRAMPSKVSYSIENYPPGTQVWTWRVPERYVVHEAYLEYESGEKVVDFKENPLHLVSYSLSVDEVLSWELLEPHLYFDENRPWAIPWKYKYYERDWGFCLPKDLFDQLPRDRRYHALIDSEFQQAPEPGFRVSSGLLHPLDGPAQDSGEIIILSHVCHPWQANDDLAGVVTALGLAKRLSENPLPAGSMSVRFLFGPETIGAIAYLAHHEDLIPSLKAGIFVEMTGNENVLAWHHSRQHDHLLDRIAAYVLSKKPHQERDFAAAPANDERVINGPGVNVPCISINRWPYDQYHTSDDNPDIIHEDMLQEAVDAIEEIVRLFATNYIPRRNFRGPVFLSGHGLWVDWQDNWELNRAIEKIMMRFEGVDSVFDIAQEVKLDYWMVRDYIDQFYGKGLIEKFPVPGEGMVE
jgi:aminopeptidase-like protein